MRWREEVSSSEKTVLREGAYRPGKTTCFCPLRSVPRRQEEAREGPEVERARFARSRGAKRESACQLGSKRGKTEVEVQELELCLVRTPFITVS